MIKITADSTCDLSPELINRNRIGIVPIHVLVDDKDYADGVDITSSELFEMVESEGRSCRTAATNSYEYEQFFAKFAESFDAIIHISLGSGFSSCYQNAFIAAGNFGNVFVVDSKNLSSGSGHIVLRAAELVAQGKRPEQIVAELEEETGRVESSFVIEKLDYLYKGGRCSGLEMFGANLLHLRPCIEVRDNKMAVGRKYRGNFDRCLVQYVQDKLEGRSDIDGSLVFITHSSCSPETVDKVKAAIDETGIFSEVIETNAGCTISSHCGPNTLGILFKQKSH